MMSPLESRAWLALWGMGPAYAVYFTVLFAWPAWPATWLERLALFGVTAVVHATIYLTGLSVLKRRERDQGLMADERDRAIDARATRFAYYALMTGAIVVGVVMPFNQGGWKIVNAALLAIVLAELLRNILIVRGYRGAMRLAH